MRSNPTLAGKDFQSKNRVGILAEPDKEKRLLTDLGRTGRREKKIANAEPIFNKSFSSSILQPNKRAFVAHSPPLSRYLITQDAFGSLILLILPCLDPDWRKYFTE
uniref:Uncharacterized protein n=1 Tax=Canis lupus familiaris TaxID=9615 RepID=A0A8I3PGJ2_CANLF